MLTLDADVLLPGHGVPVVGADRVRQALDDTAVFLESLHEQTIEMMNAGASLDEILHTVRPPVKLADRPYLQPVYDEPEFVVRNIWRLYGGGGGGNPGAPQPAPAAAPPAPGGRPARPGGGARPGGAPPRPGGGGRPRGARAPG